MSYYKKIIGEKCYLSPLSLEDADKYAEWLNDAEVVVNLSIGHKTLNSLNEKEFLEKAMKEGNPLFGIIDLSTDKLIGNCGLMGLDLIDRTAEFGIFIGEKSFWGKGYGFEATNLILDYGFNVLNLNNIMLRVFDYNKKAIRLYEKCGFNIIGKRREAKIIAGQKFDILYMDILASEFKGAYIKNVLNVR